MLNGLSWIPQLMHAPPHDLQNECDEDKTHEVNSEMRVSDILEEGNGKICYAHAPLTHYC